MKRNLIIGGTSRGGTTSLFNYLAVHPGIGASKAKETRFFLDDDYPLSSVRRIGRDGAAVYDSFFPSCRSSENLWRLEATPDYLYSNGIAERIHRALSGEVRFIFILRDPIARLRSWYRFGQAMNEVPLEMTFDDWVSLQRQNTDRFPVGIKHPAFAALRTGRYTDYLGSFVETFGGEAVYLCFLEDLNGDAEAFMHSLCDWLGLTCMLRRQGAHEVVNKGVRVRNPAVHRAYLEWTEAVRPLWTKTPAMKRALGLVRRQIDRVYRRLNTAESEPATGSAETEAFLVEYYGDQKKRLKEEFGKIAPWH